MHDADYCGDHYIGELALLFGNEPLSAMWTGLVSLTYGLGHPACEIIRKLCIFLLILYLPRHLLDVALDNGRRGLGICRDWVHGYGHIHGLRVIHWASVLLL